MYEEIKRDYIDFYFSLLPHAVNSEVFIVDGYKLTAKVVLPSSRSFHGFILPPVEIVSTELINKGPQSEVYREREIKYRVCFLARNQMIHWFNYLQTAGIDYPINDMIKSVKSLDWVDNCSLWCGKNEVRGLYEAHISITDRNGLFTKHVWAVDSKGMILGVYNTIVNYYGRYT